MKFKVYRKKASRENKLLNINFTNGYKVVNTIVPITKEEQEQMVLDIYRVLTKDNNE